MKQTTLTHDLTSGNIAVQLLRFVGPLFISNVLQTVYNVVDMAVVGQYVGNAGLSAVSVCGDLAHVLTFLAMGFSNAGQVLISQYVGAQRPDKTKRVIGNLFTVLLLIAVVFTTLSLVFGNALLRFVNVPAEAEAEGRAYFYICAGGLVFTYGYNAVSAILRGMGDSRHPFIFIAIASVMNIVLDFVFVAGLGMGSGGAALATVLSQAMSFVVSMVFLIRNREAFGFDFALASFRISRDVALPLLKLGLPMAMQYGCIQLSKLVVTSWINVYGVDVSAITGIGTKINAIGLTFASAVNTSSAAMIGQCIGAKKYERVLRCMLVAGCISVGTATLLVLIIVLFPGTVFGLFTAEAAIFDMIGVYLPVVVIMLYASALRAPMNGLINGSGKSGMNMLIAILDGIVGHMGFSAILGFALGLGLPGLWYGNASAGLIPFFLGIVFYQSGRWKKKA